MVIVTIIACPAAAMIMSASRMIFSGSLVREWTTVTVASSFRRSRDTGNPTMLLRPTTTAFFPFMLIPLRTKSSMHPCLTETRQAHFQKTTEDGCIQYRFAHKFLVRQENWMFHLPFLRINEVTLLPWACKGGTKVVCLSLQACQYSEDESRLHPFLY